MPDKKVRTQTCKIISREAIWRGVRTHGGLRNAVERRPSKQQEQAMLEEKWRREDQVLNIPPFTGTSQINVHLPEDETPLNFLDFFWMTSLMNT